MLHPALRQLLHAQSVAKWRRLKRAFATRRRGLLSLLAVMLAAVWCGNMLMSVMLRQPTPTETFARLVPIGLFVYALWHVLKTAFKQPEDAIEWTEAERELLCAGPFRRHELILYRLASILNATVLKAACFALLMLPDLRHPLAGFVGALLSLAFLDLLRLNVEIVVHGLSQPVYRRFRAAVGAIAASVVVSSLVVAFSRMPDWQAESTHLTWAILRHVFHSSGELLATLPGRIALAPFNWFSAIIVAPELSLAWLGRVGSCLLIMTGLLSLMMRFDGWFDLRLVKREQQSYPPQRTRAPVANVRRAHAGWRRVAWLTGAGPIAWRQMIGANKQRNQLAVALALPGILATLPVIVCRDGRQAAMQVSAALTFYSFLLLPTALKFDFRRDIRRMTVLKTLPIRPIAIVVGQICTPTILAFSFQTVVLLITMLVRPFPVWILVATLLLLAPLNALIFAMDNLVYLLYPYRLNQEGIEIFLRTTLTFTAKGLIFTLMLAMTFAWSFIAHQIALRLPSVLNDPALVFVLGGGVMLWGATWGTLQLLSRAYVRFDPSQDTPA